MFNSEIKFIKSLSKKNERTSSGLFVGEGSKLLSELVKTNLEIEKIYTTDPDAFFGGVCDVEVISQSQMERISHLKTPSDALALIKIPHHKAIYSGNLAIALDGVQDPGNLGTIIRVGAWYGVKQIFCSQNTVDCYSPKVVQATMGAIASVQVIYTDIVELLEKNSDTPIFGTFLEQSTSIYTTDLKHQNSIVVMGSEGQGVSNNVGALVTNRIFLPPYGDANGVESLNVAVATAITLSEFRRNIEL